MKAFFKWSAITVATLVVGAVAYTIYVISSVDTVNMPPNHGQVDVQLYLGKGQKQPLIVGIGGAEGGNAWTRGRWKAEREKFLAQGYAFLAVGYFGMTGTPEKLDRIALEGVHAAIMRAAANPAIEGECIAIVGSSKGGELALLLASRYPEIKSVVAIVPAHAVFVGLTDALTTSSFSHNGQSLPFVPFPWRATMPLLAGDKRKVFDIMTEDKAAVAKALIEVEKINGSVLLLSATDDEEWASKDMSDLIIARLKEKRFPHPYEHVAIKGGHVAPFKHLDRARQFLNDHFKAGAESGCLRK